MNIMSFIKEHPVEVGAGVIGAIILLRMFGGGSSAANNQSSAQTAYFNAVAAQGQAGDALMATQIQSNAQTAQTQIAANASVANNSTWANAQMFGDTTAVQTAQINANAAEAIAPYAVQSNLISTLGNVASTPGSVVTSSSSNGGFFGLGASSSTSSSYVPDPAAVSAGNILASLAGNSANAASGYHAGH